MYEVRRSDKIKYKTRILVPQSRLVFGVCDPYGLLEENQCYFNPTLLKQDKDKITKQYPQLTPKGNYLINI